MPKDKYWRDFTVETAAKSNIQILGVPFDGAVSNARGAAKAPARIRELSKTAPPFSEEGIDLRSLVISDRGDVPVSLDWEEYYCEVRKQAAEAVAAGGFTLFLGGDHSVTIPLATAFAGHYRPEAVGMIHLDSHCDLMDIYDGHRWSHACPQRRFLEQENTSPRHMALLGIRSYEAAELEFIKANPGLTVITARQYDWQGREASLEQIRQAMRGLKVIYLSLDIDVLDPAYAPGTGTPEAGGLTTREVIELVRAIVTDLPVKGMDLVEVAPPLDHADITSWAALKIIYEVFAALITRE